MASIVRQRPAAWFTIVAVVLLFWGLMGCWAFYMHLQLGPAMRPDPDAWERGFAAALPAWFTPVYAVAILGGVLGSLALLLRSRLAVPLYIASLVAAIVQFGWVFAATDLIAHKGAAATVPFPLFIIAVAAFQLWLARYARQRGWIG
jgi:hypothetical protein